MDSEPLYWCVLTVLNPGPLGYKATSENALIFIARHTYIFMMCPCTTDKACIKVFYHNRNSTVSYTHSTCHTKKELWLSFQKNSQPTQCVFLKSVSPQNEKDIKDRTWEDIFNGSWRNGSRLLTRIGNNYSYRND